MDYAIASAKLITREVIMHTPWPVLSYAHGLALENRKLRVELEALQAKFNKKSTNSNKPPSSDSPFHLRPKNANKAKLPQNASEYVSNVCGPRKSQNSIPVVCMRLLRPD